MKSTNCAFKDSSYKQEQNNENILRMRLFSSRACARLNVRGFGDKSTRNALFCRTLLTDCINQLKEMIRWAM